VPALRAGLHGSRRATTGSGTDVASAALTRLLQQRSQTLGLPGAG